MKKKSKLLYIFGSIATFAVAAVALPKIIDYISRRIPDVPVNTEYDEIDDDSEPKIEIIKKSEITEDKESEINE